MIPACVKKYWTDSAFRERVLRNNAAWDARNREAGTAWKRKWRKNRDAALKKKEQHYQRRYRLKLNLS